MSLQATLELHAVQGLRIGKRPPLFKKVPRLTGGGETAGYGVSPAPVGRRCDCANLAIMYAASALAFLLSVEAAPEREFPPLSRIFLLFAPSRLYRRRHLLPTHTQRSTFPTRGSPAPLPLTLWRPPTALGATWRRPAAARPLRAPTQPPFSTTRLAKCTRDNSPLRARLRARRARIAWAPPRACPPRTR